MQPPVIEFEGDNMLTGYRLEKLEVYNWGTFHNKIWAISPKGGTALLTGSNGSGKSTLVDALITLLVPNIKRGYNLASGAANKKDRNERSYVQGAFGKYKGEESQQSQTRFLRDNNDYSVLLATFANEGTAERITLGQVFYFQSDQLKKIFIVGPGYLSIAEHFSGFDNIRALKRILTRHGAEVFEKFTEYSKHFRRAFGLRSEKALDLFNQTVSIKAIKDLNSFVRNHMLEAVDIGQTIENLRRHFEDLTHTYQSINTAKKQRDMLQPIVKIGKDYVKLAQEALQLKHCVEAVSGYFARCELDQLATALAENLASQERAQHSLEAASQVLGRLQARERDLDIAINTDKAGHQIRTIEQQIRARTQDRDRARKQWDEFESHIQFLEWPAANDENSFDRLQAKGQEEQKIIVDELEALMPERDELVTTISAINREVKEREEELESLRNRKSQIPSKNLAIRQRLLDALGLDAEDLPFIGEVLKVDDRETEWQGAAERLLHSFALRIIVPEAHYERVNEFVNQEHLRGRIVYARVPATQHQTSLPVNTNDTSLLYNKLEIKPDTPHRNWLKGELVRLYDHVCCEVDEFKHLKRALTRTGLIKQNSSLHEKNDRFRVDDVSKYILGWNNRNKMLAIEAQIQRFGQQFEQHTRARIGIDDQIGLLRKRKDRVALLARFNHFSEIDWQTIAVQIQNLEEEKRFLEASSDRLKQLRDDLEKVRVEMREASGKVKGIESDQTLLKDAQLRYQKQELRCKDLLSVFPVDELDRYVPAIKAVITEEPALDNIAYLRDRTRKLLDEQHQAVLEKKAKRSTKLVGSMKEYIHVYDVTEADASPESLLDFQRFLDTIEKEDLPRHEKKFRELLKTKLLENISFFEHALFRQEEEIHEKVAALNQSLRPISYTTSTYIQLQAKPTQNVEIREFKRLLRDVFDGHQDTQESNEKTFKKINALIDRFNEDDRWTRKVTDVRFWLDFSISERSLESDEEIKYITDSAGLSGGQKAKLAYTILASAIAYQFGLDQSRMHSNSFRFVVIDEAFSKIDEDNARYAMHLFEKLGLQLLVVSPLGSTRVVEDYITACHFVANNTDGNYSQVRNLTISEYMEEKARLMVAQGMV